MQGRDHILIGSFTGAALLGGLTLVGIHLGVAEITGGAVAAGFGAILPDLDHPNSKASNSLPIKLLVEAATFALMMAGLWFLFRSYGVATSALFGPIQPITSALAKGAVVAVVLLILSTVIRSFTGHRGVTHSFVGAAIGTIVSLIGCAALALPLWYSILVGIGWLTHLAADATTHDGLPQLMWLLDGRPLKLTESRTPSPSVGPITETSPPRVSARMPSTDGPDTDAVTAGVCPRCGAPMVERVAKRGPNTGRAFLGCTNFPKCRETLPVSD